MSKDELIKELKKAITEFNSDKVVETAKKYVEEGHDPKEAISKAVTPGMQEVGEKFDRGDVFLPQVMTLGESVSEASEILLEEMPKSEKKEGGKIVIGTVEGDVHDIGKGIVQMMLRVEGFEIIDLGRDVALEKFVEAVKEHKPDIVGSSALMTTTRSNMEELEKMLKEAGVRDKVKTMIGGAPITEHYAKKIGADAYGENARDAVNKAKALFEKK